MAFSTYLADKILDLVLLGNTFTSNPVYVSLHTGDPGTTGASEVTGGPGPYARQSAAANWTTPASGESDTSASITFTGMPAVTVTHIGIWDMASGGNFLLGGALASPVSPLLGQSITFDSGDIQAVLT